FKKKGEKEKKKPKKGVVAPPDLHLSPRRGGGAGNEKSPLGGSHPNWPEGGCFFPGLRTRERAGGGSDPRHFTGARISSTHPIFTQACPRAGFWGG
ncbi:hypothetical protein UQ16_00005, partial [Escherichia coli]